MVEVLTALFALGGIFGIAIAVVLVLDWIARRQP